MFLFINFLILFSASAQDNSAQLRTKLNKVFAKIDKSQIPFGILEESSFGWLHLWQVHTEANFPTDSTHVSIHSPKGEYTVYSPLGE
jgi:hypothetical protein